MAKKKAAKKKSNKPPAVPKKERTARLPGMEDAGIPALESIAERLADVRGQRIALSKKEGELAEDLIAVMKRNEKVEYHHEEVHVWLRVTEEKIKVKIGELDSKQLEKLKPVDTPLAPAGEVVTDGDDLEQFEEVDEEDEMPVEYDPTGT